MRDKIRSLLKQKVLILDGGTGTQLQKRGMPGGVCPEKWCLENPGVLEDVHRDYAGAGSDIVYSCTFGANRVKLEEYNITNVAAMNEELVQLAKKAVKGKALVAGDIAPTGRFIKPLGDWDFEAAVCTYKEQVQGLLAGGVDLFVIETMIDIQEARAALIAVRELTDKFVIVTMTFDGDRTINGTDPQTAVVTLQSLGADAVGCNCSSGPADMVKLIALMKPFATVPLAAKPNAGMPRLVGEEPVFDMPAQDFASFALPFVKAGVNMLGGCCGTTPQHIAALSGKLKRALPLAPLRQAISAVSSARKTVVIEKKSFTIIGEKINPSGKKVFKEKLKQGDLSVIRALAAQQKTDGAHLLDVNVGMDGVDEVKTMLSVIELLSIVTDLPIVIDSSSTEVIEKALRVYPGRALINSISAEEDKFKKLLPLAVKYGAMFVLLPLTNKEVAVTVDKRKKIIKNLVEETRKYNIPRDNIIVDAMAMAVSADPGAAVETLKTIEWCSRSLGCHTVVGLSNVSFGLPARKQLNAAFLALARKKGLSLAIMDAAAARLRREQRAVDVLLQKDKGAAFYIARFTDIKEKEEAAVKDENLSPQDRVSRAILEGSQEGIRNILDAAIAAGVLPAELVDNTMIPAITEVGRLFEQRKYFLPQLIASAQTMKEGVTYLQTRYLKKESANEGGVILMATVKGDIHDIGKNIVALMLSNHGFKVIDLGKDVSAEKIVSGIKKYKPALVGLSALMTTTMVNMKTVIDLAEKEGLAAKFIVGGAAVTKGYADRIGASYAKDGVHAVRTAKIIAGNV